MPKAKPFPDSEEEEKTTIESQWEEEASTTVEQGDVAEKIRSLGVEPRRGGTSETSTGAGALDEPTVDDQHAQQSQQSAITPVRDIARLQISQGNDAGQELEIRPGKTYTIGRAIDNDFVLTDIAVSRKHFDLRFEDGAWVIVDRGSGNGTVVNGNLEDNPFMLANGDVIEIGNTVFRFDQPNAASRVDPQRTMDLEGDEEELSTVAGKPMRDADVEPVRPPALRPQRPKTLPPPMPLRAAAATQPPPLGFPPRGPSSMPQPSSTLPMAQMANRAPIGGPLPSLPGVSNPGAPAMLGDSHGMPMPNQLPTTIPGQGAAAPRAMYPYPQATEIPPHSVHAQMMLIQTQNRRGDHSTAHVPPAPYDGLPPMQRYSQPQLSKKSKLVLASIGVAVVAGVLTVAIVKSSHTPAKPVAADTARADGKAETKVAAKTAVDPAKTEPTKTVTAMPIAPAPTTTKVAAPSPSPTTVTPKTPAPAITTPTKAAAPQTATTAKTEPTKIEPTKIETPKPTPPPTVAKTETPKPTPPPAVAKTETPKPKAEKTTRRNERSPDRDRKAEARRVTEPAPSTTETPAPKRAGASPDAALAEAEKLYRQRKFSDAASYLQGQAKKFDEDVASDLRKTAGYYSRLAAAMSKATAPAQRASVAYEALVSAQTYDRSLGNAYDGEIQTKLAQVAPKAALSYVANKNYLAARNAMIFSKQFPGAAETVSLVKQKLETAASELYAEATAEMSSNPQGAKDKLKQILQITDPGSSWHKKAAQKLSGG